MTGSEGREIPQAPASGPPAPSLSVVVPATDRPGTLERCLAAIQAADDPPEQIVVVDEPLWLDRATARNVGVEGAVSEIVVFVDADVAVHRDAFTRVRRAFRDAELAAVIGSYDDRPSAVDVVSQFRNLLHHHVHQAAAGPVESFWTGLGAIRRDVFLDLGGFDPATRLEDVELGLRLSATGRRILLDPRLQGTHLKRWTVRGMVLADLVERGSPWVELLLDRRTLPTTLNLGWRHRSSLVCSYVAVGALLARRPRSGTLALAALLALNRSFYGLLLRRGGPTLAAAGVLLHVLHHFTSGVAVVAGTGRYATRRLRVRRAGGGASQ